MIKSKFLLVILFLSGIIVCGCEQELLIDEPGNLVPKTVDLDPSLPSITVNGARLHSEAFGNPEDPMVVTLHGGPGGDYRYLLNCKALVSQGYYVVFYDQRGAGLSQRFPFSSYTTDELYDDLSGVIAHYRTSPDQKIFLLGQSWGAMLATAYINRYPNAIDGAILAEPGGFVWKDIEEYVARTREFDYLGELMNDAVYAEQFLTGSKNSHEILDYKFELLAATDNSADSPLGNEGRLPRWRSGAVTFNAYFEIAKNRQPDWSSNLGKFTTKILFFYSEYNKAYGRQHAEKISSFYPNVQLAEARGTGHDMFSFSTGWNNTFPIVVEYLNSLK